MTRKEKYLQDYPNCKIIHDTDNVIYPADNNGKCLCAKSVGYASHCYAGEGFFDCRDCWNSKY